MGCIICTGGTPNKVIDGQQRLTSLTLLLIYLNNQGLLKKIFKPAKRLENAPARG